MRIGVKNLHVAVYDETTDTYETPVKFSPAINIDAQPTLSSVPLYGDDKMQHVENKITSVAVTVNTTDLTDTQYNLLMGTTPNPDGVTEEVATSKAPYVAILFEMPKAGGGVALRCYYKGRFQPIGETAQTKGETIEYQTPQLTATFMERADDKYRAKVDYETEADIDPVVYADWFTNVYEYIPTP